MRLALILALAAPVVIFVLLRWFANAEPEKVRRALRTTLLVFALAVLGWLALSGRLHWLFATIGAAVPLVMRLAALYRNAQRMRGGWGTGGAGGSSGAGRTSEVRTRFVRMELDHDSGEMRGEVLEGRFRGRQLVDLGREELLELLDTCRAADDESAALLEAWLDRVHGDEWRRGGTDEGQRAATGGGPMSRDEACSILGLSPGADREAIIDAHRRLMQKLHPDRGGSDYLAARVNQAKDVLLAD